MVRNGGYYMSMVSRITGATTPRINEQNTGIIALYMGMWRKWLSQMSKDRAVVVVLLTASAWSQVAVIL